VHNIYDEIGMANKSLSLNLTLRFAAYLTLFCLSLTVLIFMAISYLSYKHDYQDIQAQLTSIQRGYADSLAEAVWNFDVDQIRLQLDGIVKLPNISYAEVRTQQDIYSAGKINSNAHILGHAYNLEVPQAAERGLPTDIGSLYVVSNLESWIFKSAEKVKFSIAAVIFTVIMLATFSLIIVRTLFTKNLKNMAEYAKRLNLERLDIPLNLHRPQFTKSSNDEISQMENAINEMRLTLKHNYKSVSNPMSECQHSGNY